MGPVMVMMGFVVSMMVVVIRTEPKSDRAMGMGGMGN